MNIKKTQPTPTRRRRRGSILILVVALLVLMALIGTAWISTARVDRSAAVQTMHNTEVEMLIDGAVNMAKGAITADAGDGGQLRRGPGYVHADGTTTDAYLASRLPV